jgi:hypothetical protein
MDLMTMQYSRSSYNLGNASRDLGISHTNTRQDVDGC